MRFYVVPPLVVDNSMFSSSAPEPAATGEDLWDNTTTFALGEIRIWTTTHRKYESLQAGNVGHSPPTPPELANEWWLDIGPTNRWAMFDLLRNTQTVYTSPLTVGFTAGERVNSLALLGLEATSVHVTMTSVGAGGTVYDETYDLATRDTVGWYSYFFGPFRYRPYLILNDLPSYSDGVISVVITNAGGDVKVGSFIVGTSVYLGKVVEGAVSDALNFSTVERDEFGNSLLTQRRSVPKIIAEVWCEKARVNVVRDARTRLNAEPAVWFGDPDEVGDEYAEPLNIVGYYRRFPISLAHPQYAVISLEVEEV